MHRYLTIIPARKNSKRLKNKNLKFFFNKPLINFTFNIAKKIKKFDYILLSSNDDKIIRIAKKNKIHEPFKRPENLSRDKTDLNKVVIHALHWYKTKFKQNPENIVILQPTSPLRDYVEFNKIISLYEKKKFQSLLTVSEPFQDPNDLFYFKKKIKKAIKKDIKNVFFLDGGLYMCKFSFFKKYGIITNEKSKIYQIKKSNSFDINDNFEFELAEAYYLYNRSKFKL